MHLIHILSILSVHWVNICFFHILLSNSGRVTIERYRAPMSDHQINFLSLHCKFSLSSLGNRRRSRAAQINIIAPDKRRIKRRGGEEARSRRNKLGQGRTGHGTDRCPKLQVRWSASHVAIAARASQIKCKNRSIKQSIRPIALGQLPGIRTDRATEQPWARLPPVEINRNSPKSMSTYYCWIDFFSFVISPELHRTHKIQRKIFFFDLFLHSAWPVSHTSTRVIRSRLRSLSMNPTARVVSLQPTDLTSWGSVGSGAPKLALRTCCARLRDGAQWQVVAEIGCNSVYSAMRPGTVWQRKNKAN